MSVLCRNISAIRDRTIFEKLEDKYEIDFPKNMISFFEDNNGGTPLKKEIVIDDEEYEIRCFLSFNNDEYNSIKKPLETFQTNTKGKIVPIAKDSGDNYFCINLDNEKVYYWIQEENRYYVLAENFENFIGYIE